MILVFDMQDRRAVWRPPDWVPERLGEALAGIGGGTLRVVEAATEGSGDGAASAGPEALRAVEDADGYLGFGVSPAVLRRGRRLRWVHSGAAGVGGSITPELRASGAIFTNSAGIHGPPVAETVVGMLLHFARGLDFAVRRQREVRWDPDPFYTAETPVREFGRSTVGVIGFGGVGREVARRCSALGAQILALRRGRTGGEEARPRWTPSAVEGAPSAAEPPFGDEARSGGDDAAASAVMSGEDGLDRLLDGSDHVVLCLPQTPDTRGLVDGPFLRRMRPGAVLVNVGRGGLVVEDDLVEALRQGWIRGAALDVFGTEPLPPDHPFWTLPNVLLTPHVSAVGEGYWERQTALIVENIHRLSSGRPLVNVVDPEGGY